MNKKRILVVEDNPIIAADLEGYMEEFGYEALPAVESAHEALKILKNETVNLVLLDVGLEGEIDGIQLANIIKEKYDLPFIFLTAFYDAKTIERIKSTRPNAYLVKPIDEHSLKTSIEVALYNFEHSESAANPAELSAETKFDHKDHFYIKVKHGLLKIHFEEIVFFEAYDNYAYVQTSDNRHLVGYTLKYIESKLTQPHFVRAHRSYIINTKQITAIEEDRVVMGEHKVPIGKTFREDIMKRINLL